MAYKINTFISSDTRIQDGDKKLSICLSANGFSFSVISNSDKLLAVGDVACEASKSLGTTMTNIRGALAELKINPTFFAEVELIEPVQKFTLVPEHLYKKGEEKALLQTVCEVENTRSIVVDYSEKMQLYAIFITENPMVQTFKFIAPKLKHRCQHEKLIESSLREKSITKPVLALNVNGDTFDIAAFAEQQLKMCNTLKSNTKEDAAFALLNTVQQLSIKRENAELHISGNVDKDWYSFLRKYFAKVVLNTGRKLQFENEEFYHLHTYRHALILS